MTAKLFPRGAHPLEQGINVRVLAVARRAGVKIYLVGGYLRDVLMGRLGGHGLPKDFDYAVSGAAVPFARAVAAELNGHFVLLDADSDTARVVLEDGTMLDFAGCVGGGIESDVVRRDFTMNALAWDPDRPDEILDLVGGRADIASRIIRAISESNFVDDPLRMLRAFRFLATIGGTIETGTAAMIKRHCRLIASTAAERVCYELFLILDSPSAGSALKQMGATGLVEVIFPELAATRAVPPNAFHHLGLWDHSLEAVCQAEYLLPALPEWALPDLAGELSSGVTRLAATKLACLIHDIGKPDTWAVTPEGRHTFYGHDRLGAEMTERIALRLKWSRPLERFVVKLVRWHLRPGQLFHQGQPTDRAIHRFYRALGPDVPPLLLLALADLGATRGTGMDPEVRASLEDNLLGLLKRFPAFREGASKQARLLDGRQVMRLLGVGPGPLLGELLEALAEAQALNEVSTRKDAERFVAELYRQKHAK
ncbi:MAG TPA: HD domain-containing protein [Candidatus Obscuribacterales bacterium]